MVPGVRLFAVSLRFTNGLSAFDKLERATPPGGKAGAWVSRAWRRARRPRARSVTSHPRGILDTATRSERPRQMACEPRGRERGGLPVHAVSPIKSGSPTARRHACAADWPGSVSCWPRCRKRRPKRQHKRRRRRSRRQAFRSELAGRQLVAQGRILSGMRPNAAAAGFSVSGRQQQVA